MADQLSVDDLRALQAAYEHLAQLGDSRASKVYAYIQSQSVPGMEKLGGVPPGPAPSSDAVQPINRLTGQPLGPSLGPETSFPKMAGQILASPVTGLTSIPGQIKDYFSGHWQPPLPEGEPITQAMGNAAMAMLPPAESVAPSAAGLRGAAGAGYDAIKQIPMVGKIIRIPEAIYKGYKAGAGGLTEEELSSPLGYKTSPGQKMGVPDIPLGYKTPMGQKLTPTPEKYEFPSYLNAPAPDIIKGRPITTQRMPWSPPTATSLPPLEDLNRPLGYKMPPGQKMTPLDKPEMAGGTPEPVPTAEQAAAMKETPFKPVDWPEMNRMIHATATDVELPGSPPGVKPGKGQISGLAQQMFKKSYRSLTPDEMKMMHERIRTGNLGGQ